MSEGDSAVIVVSSTRFQAEMLGDYLVSQGEQSRIRPFGVRSAKGIRGFQGRIVVDAHALVGSEDLLEELRQAQISGCVIHILIPRTENEVYPGE